MCYTAKANIHRTGGGYCSIWFIPCRSKQHVFEQGVDMLMSPVRRSSRILVTPTTSEGKPSRLEVIDLNDLPANQRVGVVPNSNLLCLS